MVRGMVGDRSLPYKFPCYLKLQRSVRVQQSETLMPRRSRTTALILILLLIAVCGGVVLVKSGWWVVLRSKIVGKQTVQDRLNEFGAEARARLAPRFAVANVKYPPLRVLMVAFKSEKRLEIYARGEQQGFAKICQYPILAASGTIGPKLRAGD